MYLNIKNSFKNYNFWVFLWGVLVLSYAASIHYGANAKYWDNVIYCIQLSVDIYIGIFSYLAYQSKSKLIMGNFYLFIFLSIIPGLFANEVYNVLINILGYKKINNGINLSWTIAYSVFLSIQIFAWLYLYFAQINKSNSKTWVTIFSYTQSVAIILLSFLLIIIFRSTILSEIGTTGMINSLFETILFIAISICLARTKSRSLIYLEVGFLLLVAFNLAHRFSYSTNHYFRMFDVVWLISLITIAFGFYEGKKDKKLIEFFKHNSLHTYASAIFLTFSTILLAAFVIIDLIISSISMNKIGYTNILPINIPSILIFSYTLAFLASKLVAGYLSKPLEKISKRIDFLYENKLDKNQILNKQFNIYELNKLDKFILKIIAELKTANKIKSDFLMQMSHDFRTPASGISYLSSSIYKKIESPELKKLQKLVVNSSEQLLNFLDDVLDYSRLDNNQLKLETREFDVNLLIDQVVLFVSAKAKDKNLYIETIFSEPQISYVGDRSILYRIILNIISNAIKFTFIGGVTISLNKKIIRHSSFLFITIHDTGIGIDEKFYDYIFEPFNRIDSSNIKNSGIGLGLSNVKLMLKKINGEIHLKSEIGEGSTFSIILPV